MNISILGAGAWGTALAITLAQRHDVLLWGRNADTMAEIARARENVAYLPGHALPAGLEITADPGAALVHARGAGASPGLLVIATSVAGLRPTLASLAGHAPPGLIFLCKGFEEHTGLLPHQVARQVLGEDVACGTLSGPSFAQEVARGLPCALTFAAHDALLRQRVIEAMHGGAMRVYASEDLIGVEVGGAVKNILAIASGMLDGLALGYNARAALITRGLAEITRLGIALGGRAETFMGLAGVGDLILTCTGDLSRNRQVGLGLAQGKPLQHVVDELGHVAEGVRCAAAVRDLARAHGVEMPISSAVAAVLFEGVAPQAAVAQLLARDPRNENDTLY